MERLSPAVLERIRRSIAMSSSVPSNVATELLLGVQAERERVERLLWLLDETAARLARTVAVERE